MDEYTWHWYSRSPSETGDCMECVHNIGDLCKAKSWIEVNINDLMCTFLIIFLSMMMRLSCIWAWRPGPVVGIDLKAVSPPAATRYQLTWLWWTLLHIAQYQGLSKGLPSKHTRQKEGLDDRQRHAPVNRIVDKIQGKDGWSSDNKPGDTWSRWYDVKPSKMNVQWFSQHFQRRNLSLWTVPLPVPSFSAVNGLPWRYADTRLLTRRRWSVIRAPRRKYDTEIFTTILPTSNNDDKCRN